MGYIFESLSNYFFLIIFLIAIEFFLVRYYKSKNLVISKGFIIGWQLFACLIITILTITGSASIIDILRHGGTIRLNEINLIPFRWGIYDVFGLVMNIVMFIPVGILIPALWKNNTRFKNTVLTGFLFSLLIELSQLFNMRATDLDDLLMNTLGSAIGYTIYYLLFKKLSIFQINNDKGNWIIRNSALFTIIIIFTFCFFVGNPLLSFIWMKIYL